MDNRTAVWVACIIMVCCVTAQAQSGKLDGLQPYIQQAMADWNVPGMAVAVVKDGDTVSCDSFGVRTIGGDGPVDCDTIFQIGSVSKCFTAAGVGRLVDAGKMGWDDPVTDHLPDFELSDEWVTREITVRDLLCHRTGP
ncbi:MAG: serine hydrolase domain-containing protein [Armatimonadota bacterium]